MKTEVRGMCRAKTVDDRNQGRTMLLLKHCKSCTVHTRSILDVNL